MSSEWVDSIELRALFRSRSDENLNLFGDDPVEPLELGGDVDNDLIGLGVSLSERFCGI